MVMSFCFLHDQGIGLSVKRQTEVPQVRGQYAGTALLQTAQLGGQLAERFDLGLCSQGFNFHGSTRLHDFLVCRRMSQADV
jgi:hypothetical protein